MYTQSQFGGVDHRFGEENLSGENIFKINAPSYEAHVISPDNAPFLQDDLVDAADTALFVAMNEADSVEHGTVHGIEARERLPQTDQEAVLMVKFNGEGIGFARDFALAA
jgi:hypothetical protein